MAFEFKILFKILVCIRVDMESINHELSVADVALIEIFESRNAAREAKDWVEADKLRQRLEEEYGMELNDRANSWNDKEGRIGTQDGPDYFEVSILLL